MSSSTSSSDEVPAKGSEQGKAGKQPAMMKTLMIVVLGTWLGLAGAGGVVYFLAKSGKIPIGAGPARGGGEATATRPITLDPILANLADAGGHAYVRLGLRVEVAGDSAAGNAATAPAEATGESKDAGKSDSKATANGSGKSATELESSIRDTVLAVLGRQTSADLLGPDGKEHLKIELREAIERGAVRVDVKEVFFTDFLVQI